jgi:hypothetical protein
LIHHACTPDASTRRDNSLATAVLPQPPMPNRMRVLGSGASRLRARAAARRESPPAADSRITLTAADRRIDRHVWGPAGVGTDVDIACRLDDDTALDGGCLAGHDGAQLDTTTGRVITQPLYLLRGRLDSRLVEPPPKVAPVVAPTTATLGRWPPMGVRVRGPDKCPCRLLDTWPDGVLATNADHHYARPGVPGPGSVPVRRRPDALPGKRHVTPAWRRPSLRSSDRTRLGPVSKGVAPSAS